MIPERLIIKLKRLWPFTVKMYAFSFIILMSLVFGVLGWSMQNKLDTIREEATTRNKLAALTEIGRVLNHISNEIQLRADSIAQHDETRHQFYNAAYYQYWRDNRILSGSAQPVYVKAFELYTVKGQSLAEKPMANMPRSVSLLDLNNFVTHEQGRYFLYLFYPVNAKDDRMTPIQGYLGFKLDLL
jgi:hypothetical protein